MLFTRTPLGAVIIDPEPHEDKRGLFARTYCRREFAEQGLAQVLEEFSVSYNRLAGTLRGMHYQVTPMADTKLVRCTRGAIIDQIVDLRPESPTYLHSLSVELTEDNRRALYIPSMFAHGFQTLADDTEAFYQIDVAHDPASERGLRYNDPALRLNWPLPVSVISERDLGWSLLGGNSTGQPGSVSCT